MQLSQSHSFSTLHWMLRQHKKTHNPLRYLQLPRSLGFRPPFHWIVFARQEGRCYILCNTLEGYMPQEHFSPLDYLKQQLVDAQKRLTDATQRLGVAQQEHQNAMFEFNTWNAAVSV